MADQRDGGIVRFGFDQQRMCAEGLDCGFEVIESCFINSLLSNQRVSRAVKQISLRVLYACVFATCHRMAADENHICRQASARRAADFDFCAASIGDNSSWLDLLAARFEEVNDGSNWRSQIDQIGFADFAALKALL